MNICKNCKFYQRSLLDRLKAKHAKCSHSSNINVVYGHATITCRDNRSSNGGDFCGSMGRFYEPKKPVQVNYVEEATNVK